MQRHPPPGATLAAFACRNALVFVRLAHDRRFVGGVVLFVVVFVFIFIRISGRHRVAHDHEGTSADQLGGKFLGDVSLHVVAPRVWTLGILPLFAQVSDEGTAAPLAGKDISFGLH